MSAMRLFRVTWKKISLENVHPRKRQMVRFFSPFFLIWAFFYFQPHFQEEKNKNNKVGNMKNDWYRLASRKARAFFVSLQSWLRYMTAFFVASFSFLFLPFLVIISLKGPILWWEDRDKLVGTLWSLHSVARRRKKRGTHSQATDDSWTNHFQHAPMGKPNTPVDSSWLSQKKKNDPSFPSLEAIHTKKQKN